MSYKYTWRIDRVDGYPQKNGLSNVATIVFWDLEVRDTTDGSFHNIKNYTELHEPDPENFVDYLELAPEDIFPWVWSASGSTKEEWENLAASQLYDLLNPEQRLQTLTMPWLANCCPDGTNMDPASIITNPTVYTPPEQ